MSRRKIVLGLAAVGLLAAIGFVVWVELRPHDQVDSRLRSLIADDRGRVFSMSELTAFDWDRLYVLGPYSNISAIRDLADLPRPAAEHLAVDEGACLLVFLNGNGIVYYLSFKRRYGDFAQVSRNQPYQRAHARFIVRKDQPKRWPKVQWAGAA